MNTVEIGNYIKDLRKRKGLTQKDLADKLNISFQAVSKWESGESLPDTSIILDLCEILETTSDLLLNGGKIMNRSRKLIKVDDVIKGVDALDDVRKYLGKDNTIYEGIRDGINKKMNIDLDDALDNHREVLYAEVIVQAILYENKTVNMDDVKSHFKSQNIIANISKYLENVR